MNEVSLFRLYLLRALYLLFVIGLGISIWPDIIQHKQPWAPMTGIVKCILAAFSALSLLGLRYPLQMLPLMLWELTWKVIWLVVVALPLWSAGTMDKVHASLVSDLLWVVILPFVIPWGYVLKHYVTKPGDRWSNGGSRDDAKPSSPMEAIHAR